MTLANQINQRRIARGREPLRAAHIARVIRFVRGLAQLPWGCR